MARNRRTPNPDAGLGTLTTLLVLAVLFSAAGLGFVWHRNRNEELSRQIRVKQMNLEAMRQANQALDRHVEELRSHRALEGRVRELKLGLVMPAPEQILRLPAQPEPPAVEPPPLAPVRWAAQSPLPR